ncbi:SpvB/TcaC N-terminal domain-containing protein [Streptomyces sp. CC224E]|uniref:SpvB/TcaC N-terminal domain-containing protein n=1 Tax=Streptomyces sp. CC224E TaxID=3044174 RepID=UPI0035568C31
MRHGPKLTLSYDSGTGNGLFGFGWRLSARLPVPVAGFAVPPNGPFAARGGTPLRNARRAHAPGV